MDLKGPDPRGSAGPSPAGEARSAGPEAAAAPPAKGTRRKRPLEVFRENVEAIAVAVVLALIIRHFSVEAFEIPTGSMAPTLYGIHSWVDCPNCETEFNIGLSSDSATGDLDVGYEQRLVYRGACPRCRLPQHRASRVEGNRRMALQGNDAFTCPQDGTRWTGRKEEYSRETVLTTSRGMSVEAQLEAITCPICWFQFSEVITSGNRTGGHKILVNKFAYKVGEPRRWDVIVFQFNRKTNYIKRLIGLPGEKVLIRGGDVHIDGKIERKHLRPDIQEVLWTKVADLDVPEAGFQKTPAWKELFPPGPAAPAGSWSWSKDQRRWSVNTSAAGAGKTAVLGYQRPLRNYYPYNLLSSRGMEPDAVVGDKKVSFLVRVPRGGRGWIGAEMREGQFAFQARIPVGKADPGHPAFLRRMPADADSNRPQPDRPPLAEGDGGMWASAAAALEPDRPATLEMENLDDRVAVRLDGKEILALEYDGAGQAPGDGKENTLLLLAGDGADCTLESIQVRRDIHYTEPVNAHYGVGQEVVLASEGMEDEYFPCGDNSPSSSDGRYWRSVPEGNLMGRALLVFWPLWPSNWQFKLIR